MPQNFQEKHGFEAEVIFYSEDVGDHVPIPFGTGYRPHLCTKKEQMLGVEFLNIPNSIKAGLQFNAQIQLVYYPDVDYSDLKKGVKFRIEAAKR